MHHSIAHYLVPWLVGASDLKRYLGRACKQCLRGRVIFFFHASKSGPRRGRRHLLCLAPVERPDAISAAKMDFQRGRFHCVELSTLRRKDLGDLTMTVLQWRAAQINPVIEDASGPSITTADAAKRLRCSVERVRSQIMRGTMIGYPALSGHRRWRIPLWQFAKENEIHAWVPELIQAYGSNGWALIHFVCVPRISLKGGRYLHLIQSGRADDVLIAAKRTNLD